MKCYDEFWLRPDMENMGYIFEYCDIYCKERYNHDIDKKKFLNAFLVSNLRKEMEEGHPGLLSQAGKTTVRKFIDVDCLGDIAQFDSQGENEENYSFNQWYWIGQMYAYLHYQTKLSTKDLVNKIDLDKMINMYYLGHEQSNKTVLRRLQDSNII